MPSYGYGGPRFNGGFGGQGGWGGMQPQGMQNMMAPNSMMPQGMNQGVSMPPVQPPPNVYGANSVAAQNMMAPQQTGGGSPLDMLHQMGFSNMGFGGQNGGLNAQGMSPLDMLHQMGFRNLGFGGQGATPAGGTVTGGMAPAGTMQPQNMMGGGLAGLFGGGGMGGMQGMMARIPMMGMLQPSGPMFGPPQVRRPFMGVQPT